MNGIRQNEPLEVYLDRFLDQFDRDALKASQKLSRPSSNRLVDILLISSIISVIGALMALPIVLAVSRL